MGGWRAVCWRSACRQGGPCEGRRLGRQQVDLVNAAQVFGVGLNATAPEAEVVRTGFVVANWWLVASAACELPVTDPRRELARRLLNNDWAVAGRELTAAELAAAQHGLLDTAAAILAEPADG